MFLGSFAVSYIKRNGRKIGKDKRAGRNKELGKLKDIPVKAKQTVAVKGGAGQIVHKHIAGVKYEDV